MQDELSDSALTSKLQNLDNIDDCWSLMLAESGERRLDNLSQLLALTSIIEREYSSISASRALNGKSSKGFGKS
jgi:hypothetical protein